MSNVNVTTPTDFTRAAYEGLFASVSEAIEFENQALSIGRSILPTCALAVLDGDRDGSPEYFAWLISQIQ